MLEVTVALPSGHSEKFSLPQTSKVGDLKILAQRTFGLGFLRLVSADGHSLAISTSLQAAGVQEGDQLTAVAQEAKMVATRRAFALWCHGGDHIVTWGARLAGGDASEVQSQLRNVLQVQAADEAFAAILADGSVVAWGNRFCGGDISAVQDQLRNVQQLQAGKDAFAAVRKDRSVVTWGNRFAGGDSSKVRDKLRNVQQIQATEQAFAAILADGSVVT